MARPRSLLDPPVWSEQSWRIRSLMDPVIVDSPWEPQPSLAEIFATENLCAQNTHDVDVKYLELVIQRYPGDVLIGILKELPKAAQMKIAQALDSIQTETPLWEYENPERTLEFEKLQKEKKKLQMWTEDLIRIILKGYTRESPEKIGTCQK